MPSPLLITIVTGVWVHALKFPSQWTGHDLHSLLFAFLDELLFVFSSEYIILKRVTVTSFDTEAFKITATG